jgi:chemotaxis response regulator CheB
MLVDDSATVRKAVRPLFDSHPNFEIVGEAEHGREAIEKAPKLRPDLIILDLTMPVMGGLEAAPLLIGILPESLADIVYGSRLTRNRTIVEGGRNTHRRSKA